MGLHAGGQLHAGDVAVVPQPRGDAARADFSQTRHTPVPAIAERVDRLD